MAGTISDRKLALYRKESSGDTLVSTQDNWGADQNAAYTTQVAQQVFAFPLSDTASKDAAFVVTLPPGGYTVVGSSAVSGGTGVMLVEVYVVP